MGISVEHRVMDAIRALIKAKWSINEPGARLWVTGQGVFLVWRSAFMDIQLKLNSSGLKGVPEDANTLGVIMLDRGAFYKNPYKASGNRHLYKIRINAPRIPKAPLEAVRLADPEDLGIDMTRYEPLEVELLDRPEDQIVASRDEPSMDYSHTMSLPLEEQIPTTLNDEKPPPLSEYEIEATSLPDNETPETAQKIVAPDMRVASQQEAGLHRNQFENSQYGKPAGAFNRLGSLGPTLMKFSEDIKSGKWQAPEVRTLEGALVVSFPYVIKHYTDNPQEFLKQCKVRNLIEREYREKVELNTHKTRELQFIVFNNRYSRLLLGQNHVI
jgi:hypothetical protein